MRELGWIGIIRLGLVQTSLGAIIVLTTSTLNRIMVVELALPAMIPGFLVAVHHIVQLARPHFGHGSDVGGRRTPWIVGGMMVLASSGLLAAGGTVLMSESLWLGAALAGIGFFGIGLGSGATGTSLLVLLAKQVRTDRKPAAATIVWFMMIAGFAVTAGVAGQFLDPYTPLRLIQVTGTVSLLAMIITVLAVYRVEPHPTATPQPARSERAPLEFRAALREVWSEVAARRFTIFVFISMLAYSLQDLILEPFAGLAFGMTPGQSTSLAGTQHGGVMAGMLAVAATGSLLRRRSGTVLRYWIIGGCIASGLALLGIAWGGTHVAQWHLPANVFLLGFANGAFAVAAIATMMVLASEGKTGREGLRMGLWGAAQAIAFAIGGFAGTVAADIARQWLVDPATAYGAVFVVEALLFFIAAHLATSIVTSRQSNLTPEMPKFGDVAMREVMDGGMT